MSHARGQPGAPGAFLDAGVVHGSSDVPWPEDRLVELVDAVRGAALYPFDDVIELLPLAQEQEIGERELRNRRVGLTPLRFGRHQYITNRTPRSTPLKKQWEKRAVHAANFLKKCTIRIAIG